MPHIPPVRVLLVEDDAKLAMLLKRGLVESGMVVDAAATGEEALARVAADRFDVIVLDLLLPGIDGEEVFRRLRAQGNPAAVVILTAHWDLDDRGAVEAADDFFPKPFSLEELVARLRDLGAVAA